MGRSLFDLLDSAFKCPSTGWRGGFDGCQRVGQHGSKPFDQGEGEVGLGWEVMVNAGLADTRVAGEVGVAEARVTPRADSLFAEVEQQRIGDRLPGRQERGRDQQGREPGLQLGNGLRAVQVGEGDAVVIPGLLCNPFYFSKGIWIRSNLRMIYEII